MPMAMGVVTDFGASEPTTAGVPPSSLAVPAAVTTPTTLPMPSETPRRQPRDAMKGAWR